MLIVKQTNKQLVEGILRHGPKIIEKCLVDPNEIIDYLKRLDNEHLKYPIPKDQLDTNNWYIPSEYQNLDIEKFLIDQCPEENLERIVLEIKLYKENNMLMILKAMKYLVDTLRNHEVIWGVGRGSSVASYALYLLGIHKIDSVKYNLPIEEFFKGEQNG